MRRRWHNSVKNNGIVFIPIIMALAGGAIGGAIGGGAIAGIGISAMFGMSGTAIGGMLGMMGGSMLGNILFPTKHETNWPELGNYPIQKSTQGPPIQKTFGTDKVAGNFTWEGDVHPYQIKHSAGGGKGGGDKAVSYETRYRQSFLIDLGEGPGSVGKIMAGNKEIWPISTGEAETPDVTIFEGADNSGIKDLTGEDYGEWPNNLAVFFNEYNLGNSQMKPNFTFEVNSTKTQWKTTFLACHDDMEVLDQDYNFVEDRNVSGNGMNELSVSPTGNIVACQTKAVGRGCFARWDSNGNLNEDFFNVGAWHGANGMSCGFINDGKYVYLNEGGWTHKCDAQTGAEIWDVNTGGSRGMFVDSLDNFYIMCTAGAIDGLQKRSGENGSQLSTFDSSLQTLLSVYDIWVDEINGKIYAAIYGVDAAVDYYQAMSWDIDGTNSQLLQMSPALEYGYSVVTKNGYVYLAHSSVVSAQAGVAHNISKWDEDWNLQAYYSTGFGVRYIWIDWLGRIVVRGGVEKKLYLFDDDLNLVSSHACDSDKGSHAPAGACMPTGIMAGTVKDVSFAYMCKQVLIDSRFGADFDGLINEASFQAVDEHCVSEGLIGSLTLKEQQAWRSWLDYLCSHFGGYYYESGGELCLGVYKDETAVFDLSVADNDFVIADGPNPPPPIQVKERDYNEAYNQIKVAWTDRDNDYALGGPAVANDESDIRDRGLREKIYNLRGITNAPLAQRMAWQLLIDNIYRFNIYEFTVSFKNMLIEIGDVGTISDGDKIVSKKVRIFSIDEEINGRGLSIVAIEDISRLYPSITFAAQENLRQSQTAIDLQDATINFREDALTDKLYLSITPAGASANGWYIYQSYDDATYQLIGRCGIDGITGGDANSSGTIQGNLPGHPAVTWAQGETVLVSIGTVTDLHTDTSDDQFWNDRRLAKIGDEIIAFMDAEETATAGIWQISNLRRGLFGTEPVAHYSGEAFCTLDSDFEYRYNQTDVGQMIYFKAVTFYGDDTQVVSDLSGTSVAIQGYHQRPAAAACLRLASDLMDGGSGDYTGASFTLYWNLGARNSGLGVGGHDVSPSKASWFYPDAESLLVTGGGALFGNYIQDTELQKIVLKFEQEDGTAIGEREIAVAESATITKATDLGGYNPARIKVVPRRALRAWDENSILVDDGS